tara:strand:- start:3091 stop:3633 length:543 start_codon:yes stop_codon:yes gene_type:complete
MRSEEKQGEASKRASRVLDVVVATGIAGALIVLSMKLFSCEHRVGELEGELDDMKLTQSMTSVAQTRGGDGTPPGGVCKARAEGANAREGGGAAEDGEGVEGENMARIVEVEGENMARIVEEEGEEEAGEEDETDMERIVEVRQNQSAPPPVPLREMQEVMEEEEGPPATNTGRPRRGSK